MCSARFSHTQMQSLGCMTEGLHERGGTRPGPLSSALILEVVGPVVIFM